MAKSKKPSPGPWYRMYVSILDNPKLARLTEAQCWQWAKLLALAVVYGGMLPLDLVDVSYRLRKPLGKVREMIQLFLSAGLLERCEDGYVPHDWEMMQFSSDVSTGRVRELRERRRNVSETQTQRPNSTETEADTEEETPLPPNLFGTFWKEFPTEPIMSKPRAEEAWETLTNEDRAKAIAACKPFKAFRSKDKTYPVLHASTFLSERRFDGFATVATIDPMQAAEARDKADRLLCRGKYAAE